MGAKGIVDIIHQRIPAHQPVYLSSHIDEPEEPGGWATLNIVGADVVEVAPAYDAPGGDTAYVAANLVYELITGMIASELEEKTISAGEQVNDIERGDAWLGRATLSSCKPTSGTMREL
ncbi:hypothetical protein DPV78_003377 [Talaromyces pinophilus]|nr:hypothetical protein DPV78_003377 [Talaromyces pinophilus]